MDVEQQHYCSWHFLPELTARHRLALLRATTTPQAAYALQRADLQKLGFNTEVCRIWLAFAKKPEQSAAWSAMQQLSARLEGVQLLTINSPAYPPLLKEIPDPPAWLYVRGATEWLLQPQLAIVGSRRASPAARGFARQFAAALAAAGLVIGSGGALGIDAAAHKGALSAGATIAVLGTGIDQCYPDVHRGLYSEIVQQGVLVSEFKPGTPPRPGHFPKRNRLIAGMSLGVLVVRAALRSGSLITARLALEYNREVFAMPGSVGELRARGSHALIKQGAKLTETVADILEELPPMEVVAPAGEEANTSHDNKLLACIDFGFTPLDVIARRSALTMQQLLPRLLDLELAGAVASEAGGYCRLR